MTNSSEMHILDQLRAVLKNDKTVQDMFKEYDVSLDEIDLIPICFKKDLEVSARTEHAIIYLNDKLEKSLAELSPYLVHEMTHYLQQTTGDKPTKGSNDDNYLDNKYEQEGFQNQTKYLAETRGDEAAEEYIEKVLDHHDVPENERESRKEKLLNIAASLSKNAGWLDETEEEIAERNVKEEKKNQELKDKNSSIAKIVVSFFNQFAIPAEIFLDKILEFNPEYAFNPVKSSSAIFNLPEKSIMNVDVGVNCLTGNHIITSVRMIYNGKDMPKALQDRVNIATGKIIKYHKPTNAWVYDSEVDGKLKPGDPKMILIAKNLGQLSVIKTASNQLKFNLDIKPSKQDLYREFEKAVAKGPKENHSRIIVKKLNPLDQKERIRKLKELLDKLNVNKEK